MSSAEDQALSRTALRLGVQAAGFAVITLLGLASFAVVTLLHTDRLSADAALTSALERSNDVHNSPVGIWLTFARGCAAGRRAGEQRGHASERGVSLVQDLPVDPQPADAQKIALGRR